MELQHRQLQVRHAIRDLDEQSGRRAAVQLLDRRGGLDAVHAALSAVNNGGTSVYDGSAVPPCLAPYAGSRNQNIYGALITQDFVFSSPQNSKPLSTTLQRAFVLAAQNMSNFDKTFRLVIQNQPAGGWASFKAGTNVPLAAPSPVVTTLDLAVAAHSVASRSVFATSSSPTANVTVDIAETSSLGGPLVVNGLTGFIVLNSDATTPGLVPPDGGGSDPGTVEVYNPNVTNPNVTNPNVTNPNVTNPNVTNPNVTNPNVTNPNVTNPNVTNADIASLNPANPNVTNPNVTNPNVTNPNVTNVDPTNPNVTNESVSDTVYNVVERREHVRVVPDRPRRQRSARRDDPAHHHEDLQDARRSSTASSSSRITSCCSPTSSIRSSCRRAPT